MVEKINISHISYISPLSLFCPTNKTNCAAGNRGELFVLKIPHTSPFIFVTTNNASVLHHFLIEQLVQSEM